MKCTKYQNSIPKYLIIGVLILLTFSYELMKLDLIFILFSFRYYEYNIIYKVTQAAPASKLVTEVSKNRNFEVQSVF